MKVFLVEDNSSYAEFLKKSLRKKFKIYHFSSAEDCLTALKSIHPDIVITEYTLPGISGMDLFQRINNDYPDSAVKFILMSRIEDGNVVLDFIRQGIRNYVDKDERVIESLISIINDPY
jgi:PleD family two-component response regulator